MSPSSRANNMAEKSSNKIFGTLARSSRADLDFERVTLESGLILQEPDQEIEHVYFLEDGLVSFQSVSSEGSSIEIGVVGSEGIVGLPAVLGGASPYRAVVQIEGQGWRMRRKSLADEFLRNR